MLNKFKEWYRKNVNDKNETKIKEALEFKNRFVNICGNTYFLGKGMIADLPDIIRVDKAAYGNEMKWTKAQFKTQLNNNKDRFYLILRKDDELVGFICISISRDNKCCQIQNVAVLPKFQHQGLSYFLITTIIERAREMELNCVFFICQVGHIKTQDLFKDLGFVQVEVKPNYYDDGENAIVLRLNLDKKNYLASNNFGR
ncbi:hypothetical protein BGL34_05185 [Fructilactobacillus lindneri]|uniref:GNAT family N-acetyltransferase n=1 Tax=Fructilactobacillus lindneri TaxID=53444 RepID=UPI0006CF9AB7|nr:GNAT family N-acetyltransferase [Fructilactobacillus lindneri]POH05502.1 hypothetical protein BGL34_05185 [Fructilactobacillus lindneri]POH07939.1 hypothetical protein BGL35_02450 [Fructilactobacillus lindneri]POH24473.1 hypothetical protein BHU33_00275 [Fructilactobacillus lindneri DSM 20690 = JCM 11027]SJZ69830.1 ribosomal-protein-alanine N-acetyltransferase [Fructilactobacillus lindneri DSM 20690 = JCM 11027]